MSDEHGRLEEISDEVRYAEGFNGQLMLYRYQTLREYFRGTSCLELGCADGLMTEQLAGDFETLVAVDGSREYCKMARNRVGDADVEIVHSLFESFEPDQSFDTVVAAHILEHVEDPIALLERFKEWVSDEGVILVDVPNANSIHRQVGVKMGLLNEVDELNERDQQLGHRRVYDRDGLVADAEAAGLRVIDAGGVFFKPLTNGQIEDWFTTDMMDGFYQLGKDYPDVGAELYIVCKP